MIGRGSPPDKETGQSPWTGFLGGMIFLGYVFAYLSLKLKWDFTGGPAVTGCFAYLPFWRGTSGLPRDYLDVLFCVVLSFQGMVAWESCSNRLESWATGLICLSGVAGAWFLIGDVQGLGPGRGLPILGWEFSRFEAGGAIQLLLLSLFLVGNLGRNLVRGKPAPVIPFRRALFSGFSRWVSGGLLFLVLLWTVQFVFPHTDRDQDFVSPTWGLLFQAYVLFGLPYCVLTVALFKGFGEDRRDPGLMTSLAIRRLFRFSMGRPRSSPGPFFRHRFMTFLMRDYAVKVFFGSVMTMFLFSTWRSLAKRALLPFFRGDVDLSPNDFISMAIGSLILTDVALGLIGYLGASRWLGNKSSSVEDTWKGWLAALICYPPLSLLPELLFLNWFHQGATGFLGISATESQFLPKMEQYVQNWALIQGVVEIAFLSIYVWATASFGLRFSNLTNRGIITGGPYAFVRHPAYIAKSLSWWFSCLGGRALLGELVLLAFLNVVYYARAVTEEAHLSRDPEYRLYCEKVKFRFIPGIW